MNTYCDDCKRCTGGNMRKTDVPGGDDHNRCWECEATIQAGMAEADAMISDLRAERDALRERCEKLEWLVEVQEFYMYRLRNPGGWSTPGMERAKIGVAWQRRSAANDELRAMYLAATEVE